MSRSFSRISAAILLATWAAGSLGSRAVFGADSELTNYRSGISVIWGGTKGVDYMEEYLFHDKTLWDQKVVYLKSTTEISMAHNERNLAYYHSKDGGRQTIGANGKDGIPDSGDEGVIRYRIDYERNYSRRWAASWNNAQAAVHPEYKGPFTLGSLQYEAGVPVVGTTGRSKAGADGYDRGLTDSFGDEWHVFAFADDMRKVFVGLPNFSEEFADDGKYIFLVVDPKAPALTVRATGDGQFYTTLPKAYWSPKICDQTTYLTSGSGSVTFQIRDLNGSRVFYRIGTEGPFIAAPGPEMVLDQNAFRVGRNQLQYYAEGRVENTKTRIVVRNPTHPSLGEKHGHLLFGDPPQDAVIRARTTRSPYAEIYRGYRNNREVAGHQFLNLGSFPGSRPTANNGYCNTLGNAVVARLEGWNYRLPTSEGSHGEYAKAMMLRNTRILDPLGFELNHSSDAIPSRELHYRGYYDSDPVQETLFAYDLFAARFRSDQVAGGMTPIEDYFVRDCLAGFAYEAMLWSAGVNLMGSPGMWGGARMMTGSLIAIGLSEYSTPYFGTSGFGKVQDTFAWCPYESDRLTWRAALFDTKSVREKGQDIRWNTGISDNGGDSLFPVTDYVNGGRSLPAYTFSTKADYLSPGLLGRHLSIWANVVRRNVGGYTNPGLEKAIQLGSEGNLLSAGTGTDINRTRLTWLLCCNDFWPAPGSNMMVFARSQPATEFNSIEKSVVGMFTLFWYDDQLVRPTGASNFRRRQ